MLEQTNEILIWLPISGLCSAGINHPAEGFVLVPQRFLIPEFHSSLAEFEMKIAEAKKEGKNRDKCFNVVQDKIALKLSRKFIVSTQVIQKRMNYANLQTFII